MVFGFPLTVLISLREKAKEGSLETRVTRLQYGFLYKGYRRAAYSWEVFTILRKTCIAFVSVFLISSGAKVQAYFLLALLLGFAMLTFYSRPFTSPRLNFLETFSLSILGFSVYCSFFFLSSIPTSSPHFSVGKDCKFY